MSRPRSTTMATAPANRSNPVSGTAPVATASTVSAPATQQRPARVRGQTVSNNARPTLFVSPQQQERSASAAIPSAPAPAHPNKTPMGTPSPKRKKLAVESHYYRVVGKVFEDFAIEADALALRSLQERASNENTQPAATALSKVLLLPTDDDRQEATVAPVEIAAPSPPVRLVPTSSLRRATSQLRINISDNDIASAVTDSFTGQGLTHDEFVAFVHEHLRQRTTAEEVIYNMVQLEVSGEVPSDQLQQLLVSDSLQDLFGDSEPLSDDEFNALLDRVDPNGSKIVHVGILVRVLCPDESEETIEALLEKYGVGATRREQQRTALAEDEGCERELKEQLEQQAREDLQFVEQQQLRLAKAAEAKRLKMEQDSRDRAEREKKLREEEEKRRLEQAELDARRKREAAAKAAAEAAEKERLAAEEEARRRRERELLRQQQEKAKAGCCRLA